MNMCRAIILVICVAPFLHAAENGIPMSANGVMRYQNLRNEMYADMRPLYVKALGNRKPNEFEAECFAQSRLQFKKWPKADQYNEKLIVDLLITTIFEALTKRTEQKAAASAQFC